MDIPFVQHVFDASDAKASIIQLAPFLFQDSRSIDGEIRVATLTEGTTNALFKASRGIPGSESEQIVEAVLVKVYGEGTEIIIDRDKEIRLHKVLSDHKLASSLLVRFSNGHAYRFLDGKTCPVEAISNEKVWRGVARELARWHGILPVVHPGPEAVLGFEPSIWSTAKKWLDALPIETEQKRAQRELLYREFQFLVRRLLKPGQRDLMVLGHGDLLCGNIIIQEPTEDMLDDVATVKFIDYEHCTYCPQAFELANHFAEWAGFECDYDQLPTRSTRREFIRQYLQTHHDIKEGHSSGYSSVPSRVAEAEVGRVMADVDLFRGFPGFYWGLCALIQAQASTGSIDFDYAGYAEKRFSEYWAWRGQDGATVKTNQAMPLREQRWAAP